MGRSSFFKFSNDSPQQEAPLPRLSRHHSVLISHTPANDKQKKQVMRTRLCLLLLLLLVVVFAGVAQGAYVGKRKMGGERERENTKKEAFFSLLFSPTKVLSL